MSSNSDCEIISSRILNFPIKEVYEAFANPSYLKNWWGPEGFTNTIHEFDLRPNGKWILTMHGPEKGNYQNSSIFKEVQPLKLISWTRITQPLFEMEILFEKIADQKTEIFFRMIFATKEECDKIVKFAGPKNEENFDRLEKELINMKTEAQKTPRWILFVSALFALLEIMVSYMIVSSPQSVLENVDFSAKGVEYLGSMWAVRQFALGSIFAFATIKKSKQMLTISYLFFLVMFLGDLLIGFLHKENSLMISATVMCIISSAILYFLNKKNEV